MKRKYDAPDFEVIKLTLCDSLLANVSVPEDEHSSDGTIEGPGEGDF